MRLGFYDYSSGQWPKIIEGFQYVRSVNRSSGTDSDSYLHANVSLSSAGYNDLLYMTIEDTGRFGLTPLRMALDNQSKIPFTPSEDSLPGLIPYSSTFIFDSTSYRLSSPPLSVSTGCYSSNSFTEGIEACLCYNNQPINYSLFDNSNSACVSTDGYSWGFSTGIVGIALILEALFILVSWALWFDAQRHSILVKHQRTGAGHVRNVLDLADCINTDLRGHTQTWSDTELMKALEECQDIGHKVSKEGDRITVGIMQRRVARRDERDKRQKKRHTLEDENSLPV